MDDRESYLAAYIPPQLYDRLRESGGRMRGERRLVTILFADVVGSTALGERLGLEAYQVLMNQALGAMVEGVSAYEGMVARLQGDGLLAFFGAPIAHEDDAERGVRAGLDILGRIERLSREAQRAFQTPLGVRLGIHSGPVVVGEVGSALRLEYTAIGDTINVASRLEGLAEAGTLLVSEDTWRLVEPMFEGQALPPRKVKGRAERVRPFRITGARPVPGRQRGLPGLRSRLVGQRPTSG